MMDHKKLKKPGFTISDKNIPAHKSVQYILCKDKLYLSISTAKYRRELLSEKYIKMQK